MLPYQVVRYNRVLFEGNNLQCYFYSQKNDQKDLQIWRKDVREYLNRGIK